MPGTHHEKYFVVAGVLWLDRVIDRDRPVDIFLIPKAVDEHHGHLQGLGRQNLVHRLIAPERIVARVLENLAPETDLFEAAAFAELAGRSGRHEHVVVVEVGRPPFGLRPARGFLVVDVRHVLLAERTVVEPVVAHPAIDHRIHRHRDLERRVRIDQGHERQEAVVRNADDADLSIAFRDVLHEPVNRVVRVGGVIDGRRILRTAQRSVHHVIALGSVLPAHVLDDADVAARDDDVCGVVVALQDRAEVRAVRVTREIVRVVRRARQQDGSVLRALWYKDHGVQPDAVAHRDHHVPLGIVEIIRSGFERSRRFARQGWVHRRLGRHLGSHLGAPPSDEQREHYRHAWELNTQ